MPGSNDPGLDAYNALVLKQQLPTLLELMRLQNAAPAVQNPDTPSNADTAGALEDMRLLWGSRTAPGAKPHIAYCL